MFNCDSSRVLVLLRHCPASEVVGSARWRTHLYSMNVDGSDLMCPLPDAYWRSGAISHMIWGRTPREILVDANWSDHGQEYVVFDERTQPLRARRLSRGMGPHGHLSWSPDYRWLAADTYPDGNLVQRLALVDTATGEWKEIGRFRHPWSPWDPGRIDTRCDLHPRWSADGAVLTVDTIHDGDRKIWVLQAAEVIRRLF
jgi:hypothetical protein